MRLSGIKSVLIKLIKILIILFVLTAAIEGMSIILTLIPVDLNRALILLKDIRVFIMNSLPIFFILSALYFITASFGFSFLITGFLTFLLCYANRLKIIYRDDPLLFTDLLLVSEAGEMMKNYSLMFEPVTICALIFIAVLTVLLFVFFKKFKKPGLYFRIAGAVISVVLLFSLGHSVVIKNSRVYEATWHSQFGNPLKPVNHCMSRGTVYYFTRSINDVSQTPEGYDEKLVKEILSGYETVPLPEDKKVNIISVMLEAYNDFSQFPGLEFGTFPYENYLKLKEDSYSGKLYTNIFAADTVRTERAFLTGFGNIAYNKDTPSYVRYLKENGYYTEAMHPCYGWFYNRRNVNKYLGFDNFLYYENKFGNVPDETRTEMLYNGMLSDPDFFPYITESYEKAVSEGKHYFNFSVTYQNHGPYSKEKYTDEQFLLKKPEYDEESYNIYNNYFSGIKITDKGIKQLRDFADSREEPLLLILFGDHNPMLGYASTGYEELGINIDTSTVDGAENYYCTPYIFYANEAAKKALGKDFTGEGNTVSPVFLFNELFEYIGIKGPQYMNYMQSIKDEYDVINVTYLGKDGKYINRAEKNYEKLTQRQWVEYYLKK